MRRLPPACAGLVLLLALGCGPVERELIIAPACPSLPSASPCQSIPAMPNPDLQRIDGIGDDFCAVPAFPFEVRAMAATYPAPPPALPARGELRVAWSPGYFHAFVHVVDGVIQVSTADTLWDGDAVELFVAPPSSSARDGRYSTDPAVGPYQVLLSPPADGVAARAAVLLAYPVTGTLAPLPADRFAARHTGDGYTVEVRLPWGGGSDAVAGQTVAFDLGVDVQDSGVGHRELQGILNENTVDGAELCNLPAGQQAWPACDVRTWCTPTLQ